MRSSRFFSFLASVLLMYAGCKSPPPGLPEKTPDAALEFERIRADGIERVSLCYRLTVRNPAPLPLEIEISGWKCLLNGMEINADFAALRLEESPVLSFSAAGGGSLEKRLVLDLNIGSLPSAFSSPDEGDCLAGLALELNYRYPNAGTFSGEASAAAVFPRISKPEFTITSIAILQADLVNTRFRVSLRIDNPNVFPLTLSSFGYELYGEGRLWADGKDRDALHIPAQGSAETSLFLMMNFINMDRYLLDKVITMNRISYRFTGEVEVGTGIAWLPCFQMGFDRSGNSAVLR